MSDLMMAEQLRFEAAPARRSHVRDTVFAVVLFFAALACAATALAPGQGGAAAEPGCAGACWESAL